MLPATWDLTQGREPFLMRGLLKPMYFCSCDENLHTKKVILDFSVSKECVHPQMHSVKGYVSGDNIDQK